ncbi:MAG: amidohydrolase family protein [Gemmatimonadota bacterium]
MRIDVNVFLGSYPWRRVPGTSAEAVLSSMDRLEIDEAWATHLPGIFWREPSAGNTWLYDVAGRMPRLRPLPAIHPGLEGWVAELREAVDRGAPAIRADPMFYGLAPAGNEMQRLVSGVAEAGVPLLLAVKLEDGRQRHPNDIAPDLPASAVRALVRSDPRARFIITHADRAFIDEVHFGSTPEEARRIWWDICWVWGPPEDHFETLLETVGSERFVFGTGMPLRLPENAIAKLDLLDLSPEHRAAIEAGNLRTALRAE